MYIEKFFKAVVKYTGKSTSNGLTNGLLYGVETDEDIVDADIYSTCDCVTVWNDEGQLHEIYDGEFEVVSDEDWYKVVPKNRYVNYL